jgi:hypothetical protein
MAATQEQIVTKVRAILNEIGQENISTQLLDEDTVQIDEYIKACINDAINLLSTGVNGAIVNPKTGGGITVTASGNGTGYIVLPDDYISLLAFKMKGWKRVVNKTYGYDSEQYKAQVNDYTRSGINKPVCILGYDANGKKILEYYSIKTTDTATIERFVYNASYKATDGLNLSTSDPMLSAVCYMCAALVYKIFENHTTSEKLAAVAVEMAKKATA